MLPTEMKAENPKARSAAQSSTAVHRAPDCDTNATRPSAGMEFAKLAFSFDPGTIAPKQLGQGFRRFGNFAASCRINPSKEAP